MINVLNGGMTRWDREIALLLRDHTMVRDMAERILVNAVISSLTVAHGRDVWLIVAPLGRCWRLPALDAGDSPQRSSCKLA